ncbi:MAG: hypothetical protein RLZZ450_6748 [Pseudomonadota bacterium]|jgi:zinc protease
MKRLLVVYGAAFALSTLSCTNEPSTLANEGTDNATTAKVDAGTKRAADAAIKPRTDAGRKPDAGKPDAGGSGQLRIPPLAFRSRKLPNGLTLYSAKDTNTARVTVQVWYKVGSKDDPEGRSGFAHLFEHLMFKATRNLPPETLDRLTEDVGGSNNAFTADDTTAYAHQAHRSRRFG